MELANHSSGLQIVRRKTHPCGGAAQSIDGVQDRAIGELETTEEAVTFLESLTRILAC